MGLIAIGDIHGCAQTLDVLLERIDPEQGDHLVFIGDYIDRGPDSKGVIDRLIELSDSYSCTFLRGNHEALMLSYLDYQEYDLWSINGGIATLSSYLNSDHKLGIPAAHEEFIRKTELYYDTPGFFFVHAGLKPYLSIAQNLEQGGEEVYLWERGHLKEKDLAWEKTVVCGHTPQPEPMNTEKLINIDTGCVYYMHPKLGKLCAVRLPEREYILVDYVG
jgi:serine/threonine protein phosphatase 1